MKDGRATVSGAVRLAGGVAGRTLVPMKFPTPKKTLREYIRDYEKEHTKLGTKLTHMVGIPMIVASIPTAFVNPPLAGGMFVGGWAFQYAGHWIFEGNNPAFYGDPYYLLVGPVWVAAEWMSLVGLPVPEMLKGEEAADANHKTVNGEAATAVS
jgi:uncharacterized membrane protein YGL010W